MIYFTADQHFNHHKILEHYPDRVGKPVSSIDEMNEGLIDAWNSVVHPSDTVWVLGDFGFTGEGRAPLSEIFDRLKGVKCLIKGNHDERNRKVLALPWHVIHDIHTLRYERQSFILCHYPLLTWKGCHSGSTMLHGHSHGSPLPESTVKGRRIDVGVDAVGPHPITIESLLELEEAA